MSPLKTRHLLSAVVLLAVLVGGFVAMNYSETDASRQSTDDAYIQADFTVVSPQVSGRIAELLVADNQWVEAGQTLALIDDRDLRIAVDSAKAQVMTAQAVLAGLDAQIVRQGSAVLQARSTIEADAAALMLAQANHDRFSNLAADGSGTLQAQQQAQAQLRIQQAGREKDIAMLLAVRQQTDVLRIDARKAKAGVAQAGAALAAAELNLAYTRIVAPIAGNVGQRSVRVGAYVITGKPLLAIVPLDAIYVEANFRETQLTRVRPGQPVSIKVDALPGTVLRGRVESLGPASGASFSAIAPHNATGNFTKIVQRLPVRISIDASQEPVAQLRVGMSVVPAIDVHARSGGA
jgi:membrane fusion protein (multidrug efflux system)